MGVVSPKNNIGFIQVCFKSRAPSELMKSIHQELKWCWFYFAKKDQIICKHEVGQAQFPVMMVVLKPLLCTGFFEQSREIFLVNTKSDGDRGSPWFRPLFPLNHSSCCPLMLIANYTGVIHLMIHCVKRGESECIEEHFDELPIDWIKGFMQIDFHYTARGYVSFGSLLLNLGIATH